MRAAIAVLGRKVEAASRIISSAPIGPSRRRYANAVLVLRSKHGPVRLLAKLKKIERSFGRRRGGARWGPRVLDLDIVLWQGGAWSSKGLTVPHIDFRTRPFVLEPAAQIAPLWRDPLTGLTLRQLRGRLQRSTSRRLTEPDPLPIGQRW